MGAFSMLGQLLGITPIQQVAQHYGLFGQHPQGSGLLSAPADHTAPGLMQPHPFLDQTPPQTASPFAPAPNFGMPPPASAEASPSLMLPMGGAGATGAPGRIGISPNPNFQPVQAPDMSHPEPPPNEPYAYGQGIPPSFQPVGLQALSSFGRGF